MLINKRAKDAKSFKVFLEALTKQIFSSVKKDVKIEAIALWQLIIEIDRIIYGTPIIPGFLINSKKVLNKTKSSFSMWAKMADESRFGGFLKDLDVIEEADAIRKKEGNAAYHEFIKYEDKMLFGYNPRYFARMVCSFVVWDAYDRANEKADRMLLGKADTRKKMLELLEKYRMLTVNAIMHHVKQMPYYDFEEGEYDWNLYDFTKGDYYDEQERLVTPRRKPIKRQLPDLNESGNLALLKMAVILEPDTGFLHQKS